MTPSLYGTASVISLTTAATVTLTTRVVSTGVKEVVKPVFLEKLKVDLTKQQGDVKEFGADYESFIDGLLNDLMSTAMGRSRRMNLERGLLTFSTKS